MSWNIINNRSETFNTPLKSLKLRLSAGTVGNREIADGLYAANYTAEKSSQDGEPITVYSRARLGNPDLKWETTTQYNVGVDAGLLNRRLTLAADVYYKKQPICSIMHRSTSARVSAIRCSWRQLDFYASLQGSADGKIYNQLRREPETSDGTYNFSAALLNVYTAARP